MILDGDKVEFPLWKTRTGCNWCSRKVRETDLK